RRRSNRAVYVQNCVGSSREVNADQGLASREIVWQDKIGDERDQSLGGPGAACQDVSAGVLVRESTASADRLGVDGERAGAGDFNSVAVVSHGDVRTSRGKEPTEKTTADQVLERGPAA